MYDEVDVIYRAVTDRCVLSCPPEFLGVVWDCDGRYVFVGLSAGYSDVLAVVIEDTFNELLPGFGWGVCGNVLVSGGGVHPVGSVLLEGACLLVLERYKSIVEVSGLPVSG